MSQENVEIVRASWEARNRGDWETVRAHAAPDFELDFSSSKGLSPGVYRGFDSVMHIVDEGSEVFDDRRWEADEFIDAGDAVVVPGRLYTRGRGSGVETVARGVEVYWLANGKVVRWRLCQDRAQALEAVGLGE